VKEFQKYKLISHCCARFLEFFDWEFVGWEEARGSNKEGFYMDVEEYSYNNSSYTEEMVFCIFCGKRLKDFCKVTLKELS